VSRALVLRVVLAAVLGVACAVLVACGGKRDHLIPSTSAASIEAQLSSLQSDVDQGRCIAVGAVTGQLTKAIDTLPKTVNADLRRRLDAGVRNLARIAPGACESKSTVTQTTPAVTTDTTATEPPPETTDTEPPPETTPSTPEPPPDTTSTENRQDTLPGTSTDDTGGAIAP
jgi:hypothetical protein